MSLTIYDNRVHFKPIGGSRIRPSGLTINGTVALVYEWACPRCGQEVDNHGGHLEQFAPCRDCREFLREEYGDLTRYDRRRPLPPEYVFESWPAEVDLEPLGFPLAVLGADLPLEDVEGFAA